MSDFGEFCEPSFQYQDFVKPAVHNHIHSRLWSTQVAPLFSPQVPRLLAARLVMEFADFSTLAFEAVEPQDAQIELKRLPEYLPPLYAGSLVLPSREVLGEKVTGVVLSLRAGYGRALHCRQEV